MHEIVFWSQAAISYGPWRMCANKKIKIFVLLYLFFCETKKVQLISSCIQISPMCFYLGALLFSGFKTILNIFQLYVHFTLELNILCFIKLLMLRYQEIRILVTLSVGGALPSFHIFFKMGGEGEWVSLTFLTSLC